MRVAAAQTAPTWLDKAATTEKVCTWIEKAAHEDVELLAFGESFLPGYPFWVDQGGASRFEDEAQGAAYARTLEAGVEAGGPELARIEQAAADCRMQVYLGIAERGVESASGSLFCTLAAIDPVKGVVNLHRKLSPTAGERLVWARGDGQGLRAQRHDNGFVVGGLNCWENWMPQARHALQASGVNLHVAIWPGAVRNTEDITRFAALEGRCYVLSAGALLGPEDLPADFELETEFPPKQDGGSAIAGPDGAWLVAPVANEERLVMADLELSAVHRARRHFDSTGHYSRPDVFDVRVRRKRLDAAVFEDG